MSTATLVAIVVPLAVVVTLVAVGAWWLARRRRLRDRFGPEYDRTVEAAGGQTAAERELRERERRHDRLELNELPPETRDRYARAWTQVQEHFVDGPDQAVHEADELVTALMGDRGYPTTGYQQQLRDLSVEHAPTLEHYRLAHSVNERSLHREATTEELRGAMVHFRALFDELLGDGGEQARQAAHA